MLLNRVLKKIIEYKLIKEVKTLDSIIIKNSSLICSVLVILTILHIVFIRKKTHIKKINI